MQAMDLLPYRVWGTDLQAPVFSGGVGRGSLGCTPGLPSIPHLPPWCCAVSERILFCWPPAWASLSILPSERQGGPHRGHPDWRDSCEVCQPCCPSAQGRDILWGLSLVTPPDLPNLSQWSGAQEPLSSEPHRGVLLAGLGVWALVITPVCPPAGTVGDITGQDEYSASMAISALSCLISNFISFAKTDFFFYYSELSWVIPSLTCSHPPTHIYNLISLRNYFLLSVLFFLLSFHWK